jgi:hypothetical protein
VAEEADESEDAKEVEEAKDAQQAEPALRSMLASSRGVGKLARPCGGGERQGSGKRERGVGNPEGRALRQLQPASVWGPAGTLPLRVREEQLRRRSQPFGGRRPASRRGATGRPCLCFRSHPRALESCGQRDSRTPAALMGIVALSGLPHRPRQETVPAVGKYGRHLVLKPTERADNDLRQTGNHIE